MGLTKNALLEGFHDQVSIEQISEPTLTKSEVNFVLDRLKSILDNENILLICRFDECLVIDTKGEIKLPVLKNFEYIKEQVITSLNL